MAIGAIIGGAAALGTAATTAWNAWQTWKNNQYQKEVQKETWKREDTAQQRAVADLRAAGLSPTLAAGRGAPTSTPIKPDTPNIKHSPAEIAAQAMSLMQMKANISETQAEADLKRTMADRERELQPVHIQIQQLKRDLAQLDYDFELNSKGLYGNQGRVMLEIRDAERRYIQQKIMDLEHNYKLATSYPQRMTGSPGAPIMQYMGAAGQVYGDAMNMLKGKLNGSSRSRTNINTSGGTK